MQDGMTALMLACANKKIEAAALLLMEATQKAGALDVQVNVVWSVCWEGGWAGQVCGGRVGRGGRGTDTCVYVPLQGGDKNCSALHIASVNGLESAVAKLLSLGVDAALKTTVRAART
jgi:ankyrin repeat protein